MRGHSLTRAQPNAYLPREAEIVRRVQESSTIFTLYLRFTDPVAQASYTYDPGQFNMLYLHGVGEVAISIVSDPEHEDLLVHTINRVGRVTRGIEQLREGQRLGIRGPFGRGWPLREAEGRDVIIVSGGLGCAPVVSVINHMIRRRERFGHFTIVQKVKKADELIWPERYERWQQVPDTTVLVSSTERSANWRWQVSSRIQVLDDVVVHNDRTIAMLCGPGGFMGAAATHLAAKGVPETAIYLSTERNMQCAVGHCGHCQFGATFICKDGPIYAYPELKALLEVEGF
jgi:NAD(P)H-flavin reductase